MDDQHQKQPPAQQQQHYDDGSSPMMMMMMMMAPYLQNLAPPPAWNQAPPPPQVPRPHMMMMMLQPTTTTSAASSSSAEEKVRTLWIGDLEPWMSEDYINLCFEHTGEFFTSRVIRNEETGKSECFGFIQFETHAIADSVLLKFNGMPMPRVVGSLFTLDWASVYDDDIFTPTTYSYTPQPQVTYTDITYEKEGVKYIKFVKVFPTGTTDGTTTTTTTTTRYDYSIPPELVPEGPCGLILCPRCSREPPIFPDKPWWLLPPESEHLDAMFDCWVHSVKSGKSASSAHVALRTAAKARIRSATKKKKTLGGGGGAPQESQAVVVERVHLIADFFINNFLHQQLEEDGVFSATFEDMLDELKGYVKSIDVASEIHSAGGLSYLLKLTNSDDTDIQAKAAELITAMVHNNPRAQRVVMAENGLHILLHIFISGSDATVRTNAFYAISSLIWNDKHSIAEFRSRNGYVELRDALLTSVSATFQRKALDLIQHLLHESSSDCNIVTELGLPSIMMYLAFSDDAEVREAALGCLLVLARVEEVGGNSGLLVKNDDKLKQVLKVIRMGEIMAPEDLAAAARKERQLVDSLWNACYNEPFSPRAPLLCQPLRAWAAAARAAYTNSVGEKEEVAFFLPHGLKKRKLHFF